mgnify:CR=1 FL=1
MSYNMSITGSGKALSSAELVSLLETADFSDCSATIIGYGTMGKEYLKALLALGVGSIRVCAKTNNNLSRIQDIYSNVETISGDIESLALVPEKHELGIIATPIKELFISALRLSNLGFRRLLIEKPVSLASTEIDKLQNLLSAVGTQVWCGYNRISYPSFYEVKFLTDNDGGITSCTYSITELVKPEWTTQFGHDELSKWGIANSIHVISMAHKLIGMPEEWNAFQKHPLDWHDTGSIFVGSGISDQDIAFSYHADWQSKSRWKVEVHTQKTSYLLCPLEQIFVKRQSLSDWTYAPIQTFNDTVKTGILEQTASALGVIGTDERLATLQDAATLTSYAETVFGYKN